MISKNNALNLLYTISSPEIAAKIRMIQKMEKEQANQRNRSQNKSQYLLALKAKKQNELVKVNKELFILLKQRDNVINSCKSRGKKCKIQKKLMKNMREKRKQINILSNEISKINKMLKIQNNTVYNNDYGMEKYYKTHSTSNSNRSNNSSNGSRYSLTSSMSNCSSCRNSDCSNCGRFR